MNRDSSITLPAADLDYYITAPSEKYPLDYAHGESGAAEKLQQVRDKHPDARIETTGAFFARQRSETLAEFPLSRVTEHFYNEMLGCLPPFHMSGAPGFFVSEAVTQGVHAQFIEHRGAFYGGYADLTRDSRKVWTVSDILALEADPASAPPLKWYPK